LYNIYKYFLIYYFILLMVMTYEPFVNIMITSHGAQYNYV